MRIGMLTVFMYHRVLPEVFPDGVSVETFNRQLRYLAEHYDVLDATRLMAFTEAKATFSGPCAAIVFDDGWVDNWLFATPILQNFGLPAILALTTGYVHAGPARQCPDLPEVHVPCTQGMQRAVYDNDPGAFLRLDELKRMLDTGLWSIQAHGHSHNAGYYRLDARQGVFPERDHWALRYALQGLTPFSGAPRGEIASELACRRRAIKPTVLAALRAGAGSLESILSGEPEPLMLRETTADFCRRVRSDLEQCRSVIASLGTPSPELLFWPWGQYSEASVAIARECGFRRSFSVEKGCIVAGDTRYVLPRIGVSENWRKFQRNGFVFRHPFLIGLHRIISPSPKGVRSN